MTEAEATALIAGGVLGGLVTFLALFLLVFYILLVIALWKIFTKAGEAGWKSLIPIYNAYVLCKILGVSFWVWVIAIPVISSILISIIAKNNSNLSGILEGIVSLVVTVKLSFSLAKSFGKGTGFAIGLIFFPNIFQLILGFGSAQYVGPAENN